VLIVFAGPPCAGKSTLAAEIAVRRRLPHLSMDAVRQRILPRAAHTCADRAVAYRAMHLAAELLLAVGAGAILDAPYGHPEDREEVAHIAGAQLRLIECKVPLETALARFRARGPDAVRKDLTEDLVRRLVAEYPYTRTGLLLDTSALSIAEAVRRIDAWL